MYISEYVPVFEVLLNGNLQKGLFERGDSYLNVAAEIGLQDLHDILQLQGLWLLITRDAPLSSGMQGERGRRNSSHTRSGFFDV